MKYTVNDIRSIDDISVGQYDRYLNETKNMTDETELMFKAVEIFLDIEAKLLYNMPNDFIFDEAANIFDCTNQKVQLSDTVTLDGVTYRRIEDLNHLTFGQYIDLDTYLQEDIIDLGLVANVLWSKDGEYKAGANLKDFPLGQALATVDFFFNGEKDSYKPTKTYTVRPHQEQAQ